MSVNDQLKFGADVSRLLDIVAHALYSNRDVFLRELISNSADACDRLRYEAIKNPKLTDSDPEFRIRIYRDPQTRTVTVIDNGIGMDKQELIDNLGTIAKSGTAALMDQINEVKDKKEKLSLIGQFGVGFYASFMVASHVTVISKKADEAQPWLWESDGKTGFTVREANDVETATLESNRGTAIILKITDEASEYLVDQKLKTVIQTYSDHIDFPIYIGKKDDEKADKDPVNSASAIWAKPKSEITEEQYSEFYKHISHGYDEPLHTCHWKAEGKIEYTALLYMPTMRPWDLYDPTRRHSVRLYVKRVFITDDCEGLMYPWLRFVRGIIDSADLPLNISREMLQHNPVIAKIRMGVARKILSELNDLSKKDIEAFYTFWGQFGAVIKEGLYDAHELREDLFKICRFHSSHEDGALTSLSEYVDRASEEQEFIYYISGENLNTLKNSPQLEGFKARNIEVLFFTDTIDDFWLQVASEYQGKTFKSVTKGDIELPNKEAAEDTDKDHDETDSSLSEETNNLLNALNKLLDEEVETVKISSRLTDSPVCLIASDQGVDMRMERVLRVHQQYEAKTKRVMEINIKHPLIKKLTTMNTESNEFKDVAWLLLDQARIIQGEPIPDPTKFAKRMSSFMEKGLAA